MIHSIILIKYKTIFFKNSEMTNKTFDMCTQHAHVNSPAR